MAESAGYQAEQTAEQDQGGGGGFRAWFVAHERTVLIVGLLGIGVTIYLFWRGRGSGNANSNTVPGSGGIPTSTVTDSSTTQALDSLTTALTNALGQLQTQTQASKLNAGQLQSLGVPANIAQAEGGKFTFAEWGQILQSLSVSWQNLGTAWGQSQLQNWFKQGGTLPGQGGSGSAPGASFPINSAPQAAQQAVAASLPATQQTHYPLGALTPRPVQKLNGQ